MLSLTDIRRLLGDANASEPQTCFDTERHRLWSLYEMLEMYALHYTVAVRDLGFQIALLSRLVVDGNGELAADIGRIRPPLAALRECIKHLPVSPLLSSRFLGFVHRLDDTAMPLTNREAFHALSGILNDVVMDLGTKTFVLIPPGREAYYRQNQPAFGQAVADEFPECDYDIGAATRCLALEQWTACVFHLMRVVERGLHHLARELQVPMSADVDLENWRNIIDQIDAEIRKLEQSLPRGREKTEILEYYGTASAGFNSFKNAWRNHVAHARSVYDEMSAIRIWNHVQAFMQTLASRRGL
jgi:hypothetical protein